MNIKRFIYTLVIGGLGGVAIILIFSKLNFISLSGNISDILNNENIIERVVIEKKVEIVSQDEAITEKINESSGNIVLIQAFRSGQILRYGSGALLTRNILVTTGNVVPSIADTFQIYVGDKIVRGKVVKRDFRNNLALVEIPETDRPIADFSSSDLKIGEINYIVGKYLAINEVMLFSQQAMVSRIDDNFVTLDSSYENDLSGSVLIDKEGRTKGIIFIDGSRVKAVKSEVIKKFFESYSKEINESN